MIFSVFNSSDHSDMVNKNPYLEYPVEGSLVTLWTVPKANCPNGVSVSSSKVIKKDKQAWKLFLKKNGK